MEFQDFGNGRGPEHVKVRLADGSLEHARTFGGIEELSYRACAPEPDRGQFRRQHLATSAELHAEDIAKLAALIREVDADHTLGAAALAEALIDRGISFRPRS